ncbi:peptide/nickel transport system ATP-binding protein [Paracoccus pantotrophus]|uniref:ABC transporter ATP-binding protein n=2 Tax=Paracoccus pantotrophus TaxID=82367 RepID=A0AAE6NU96_PARPN|nr:ABC transporter ATP-binding protein [Paracoccus pantotrophus]QFG36250.1 ABC transporter ATP-binding protein [Paracoccus pantotrophus]RKS43174.1 peptide/nickel transport system ATP-binding protein [Paracoccus pantotrophus]RNI15104.1 ABC transporter ATP-binding protein [Paracoccus pantotrophus]
MTKSSAPLLSIRDLSVSFGDVSVVRNVSFDLHPGEVLGIVGESGSGKSITCRALMGLLPEYAQVSGQIRFDGQDMTRADTTAMRALRGRYMSMIFQNPSSHLDPLRTIGHHIAEPIRLHRTASNVTDRVLEILRAVRINDPAQRMRAYPHELSGGMKQRVMIGGAIACAPRILLADEPTTALDVTVQAHILKVLRDLNRELGLAVILVSHDLAVVAQMCDRVLVMRSGEVLEQGSSAEILRNPGHDYTRLLIASQPDRLELPPRPVPGETSLFSIRNLDVTYQTGGLLGRGRGVRALQDVSLDIRKGECFGIVGESGSGKSTMAKVLMRLVTPSSGQVLYRGADVHGLHGNDLLGYRRKVQMAFQNPFDSLNPAMTVIEAIAEPLRRHGLADAATARKRALEMMALVELPEEYAHRRPRQLSGGQCQRVGIARALILDPEVLVADEITSALDVTIQAQILRLLARLRRERDLTVIYISHDLDVVRKLCDRIAVFRAARLVESGETAQVLDQPQSEYTALLRDSVPRMHADHISI